MTVAWTSSNADFAAQRQPQLSRRSRRSGSFKQIGSSLTALIGSTGRTIRAAVFACSIATCLAGCASKAPPVSPAMLADPKTAAVTFARSLDSGNVEAAKAASIGAQQQQWVESMGSMSGGLRAAAAAMNFRFGGRGAATSGSLTSAAHTLTGETLSAVEGADAQVNGDTARMLSKNSFETSRLKIVSNLRRDNKGLWRVDLPAAFKQYPVLEGERMSPILSRYRSAGKRLSEVAKDIRDGKYATVAQAQNAIAERVGE